MTNGFYIDYFVPAGDELIQVHEVQQKPTSISGRCLKIISEKTWNQ